LKKLFSMVYCFCFNCFCLNCLGFPKEHKKEVICKKLRLELNNNDAEEWGSSDSIDVVLKLEANDEAFNSSAKDMAGCLRLGNVSTYTITEETRVDPSVRIIQSCAEETEIPEELSYKHTSFERISARDLVQQWESESPSLKIHPSSSPGQKQWQKALSRHSSTQTGYLTVPSDWGDMFYGLDSLEFTKSGSVIPQTFSPIPETSGSSDQLARESRLSIIIPKRKRILLSPGEVMGMFILKEVKEENLFQILNLNSTLDEVVDKFLIKVTGVRLPIRLPKTEANLSKTISIRKMGITLSESLGPQFDPNNQGLVFSAGPVNSKYCYKISVCELSIIETLFFIDPDNLPKG